MAKTLGLLCIPLIILAILLSIFTPINHALFILLNQAFPSKILWMTVTNTGDAIFIGCLLFIVLHKNMRLLTNALLCGLLIHYTIKFCKSFFAVLRPENTADIAPVITLGPALDLQNFAMPSGHTASAFMAVIFIAHAYKFKNWKLWMLFTYAVLIGISRIAVGAHWPADLFAGAVIGILIGLLCTHERWNFKHIAVEQVTLALYLPFILLAVSRVKHVHDTTSLTNESPMILAGLIAFVVWVLSVHMYFNKKRAVIEQ